MNMFWYPGYCANYSSVLLKRYVVVLFSLCFVMDRIAHFIQLRSYNFEASAAIPGIVLVAVLQFILFYKAIGCEKVNWNYGNVIFYWLYAIGMMGWISNDIVGGILIYIYVFFYFCLDIGYLLFLLDILRCR